MNLRPILIATCCAIALVAFVYFFGKQHFSPSVDETVDRATRSPTSKPVTVNKSPTPSESFSPEASEINIPAERKEASPQRDTESTTDEGMTYEQAQRYSEWLTHHRKLQRRLSEYAGKEIAHAEAMTQSSEDERAVIRSVFKLMSPEQLQAIRREASEIYPRDEVENFFEAVANDPTRTSTQILEDAQKIVDIDEINNLVFEQLGDEFKQLKEELRASEREFEEIMKGDNE